MPATVSNPIDRLATLETRVAAIDAALAQNRRRGAEQTAVRETWAAVTREAADENYPRYNATDADQLPIVFLEGSISGGVLSWSDRSAEPRRRALSPVGWLPPGTRVEVAWDGAQYRIVRSPTTLVGYAKQTISPRSGARCTRQITPGSGLVQIAQLSNGTYHAQSYRNGAAVLASWANVCPQTVWESQLCWANQQRDLEWLIESCCQCEESSSCPSESSSESSSDSSSDSSSPSSSSPSSSSPSSSDSSSPSSESSESSDSSSESSESSDSSSESSESSDSDSSDSDSSDSDSSDSDSSDSDSSDSDSSDSSSSGPCTGYTIWQYNAESSMWNPIGGPGCTLDPPDGCGPSEDCGGNNIWTPWPNSDCSMSPFPYHGEIRICHCVCSEFFS